MSTHNATILPPVVSVVITTQNRSALSTVNLVPRLNTSPFVLDTAIVGVGSTDDTHEMRARSRSSAFRTAGVEMARARSLGRREARGDLVTILDDDEVLLPEAVVTQFDDFAPHPKYAVEIACAAGEFDSTLTGDNDWECVLRDRRLRHLGPRGCRRPLRRHLPDMRPGATYSLPRSRQSSPSRVV